jgi:hypothetical protein
LTLRYKKFHQRQKDLQSKIDTRISNDIYNVQRILEVLVKQKQNQIQNQGQEKDFIQCIETIEETSKREKQQQGQVNSNITNTIVDENEEVIIDYKTKADWYASFLMYNSY